MNDHDGLEGEALKGLPSCSHHSWCLVTREPPPTSQEVYQGTICTLESRAVPSPTLLPSLLQISASRAGVTLCPGEQLAIKTFLVITAGSGVLLVSSG